MAILNRLADVSPQFLSELKNWLDPWLAKETVEDWTAVGSTGVDHVDDVLTPRSVPYKNSWTWPGGNLQWLRFLWRKGGYGTLEGFPAGGNLNTVITTLPDYMRPKRTKGFVSRGSVPGSVATWRIEPSGDVIYEAELSNTTALPNIGVPAGTYGDAADVGQVTVDNSGRTTNAVNVPIQITESQVTSLTADLTDRASKGSGSAQVFTSNVQAPALIASGLTGATAASRYVGATTSGAPGSGTFAKGDFVIDQTASMWVCTVAGSPGTWVQVSGGGSSPLTTKGDLFTHSTVDARLGAGANGTFLTADSTQTTGLKWASGGGGSGLLTKIYDSGYLGADTANIDTGAGAITAGFDLAEKICARGI